MRILIICSLSSSLKNISLFGDARWLFAPWLDARWKTAFRTREIFRGAPRFSFFFILFTRDMHAASEREPEREHNESYYGVLTPGGAPDSIVTL